MEQRNSEEPVQQQEQQQNQAAEVEQDRAVQKKAEQTETEEECPLCFDALSVLGVIKCNHGPFCYKCMYKMRELNKSLNCPICVTKSQNVIYTTNREAKYDDYDLAKLKVVDKDKGIYCASKEAHNALRSLNALKCMAPNCKDYHEFESMIAHTHNSEICFENKKCVLPEHTLYSRIALDRHLKQGEMDEDGFVFFFHPYCTFCDKLFYDEEKLTTHLTEHFTCFLCAEEHKWIYYNDYPSLERHFRMSHYLCEDPYCLQQAFTAFKTAQDQELHNRRVHRINRNQDIGYLAGFKYEDDDKSKRDRNVQKDGKTVIRDKEGVDFQPQLLSQQKAKVQVSSIDDHEDGIFDFREFYNLKYDEEITDVQGSDDIIGLMLSLEGYRHISAREGGNQEGGNSESGGTQGRSKKRRNKYGEDYLLDKNRKNRKDAYLEDLRFLRYNQLYTLREQVLEERLEKIFKQDEWDEYHDAKARFFKNKTQPRQFLEDFIRACGATLGYRVFPLFIRTIQNQNTAKNLDQAYLRELSRLPKKVPNLINTSESYSDFFKRFRAEIEQSIVHRIESRRLSMKKRIKMERTRIFQLIEILRRVRTPEMAKLKFATNFGLSLEGIDYILNKVYFVSLDKLQDKINKIPTQDFLKLYLYVSICDDMIQGKYVRRDKRSISTLLLKDFFTRHPDVVSLYCSKYRTNISDDDSDQERKEKFFQSLDRYNYKNEFHFPSLAPKKPQSGSTETTAASAAAQALAAPAQPVSPQVIAQEEVLPVPQQEKKVQPDLQSSSNAAVDQQQKQEVQQQQQQQSPVVAEKLPISEPPIQEPPAKAQSNQQAQKQAAEKSEDISESVVQVQQKQEQKKQQEQQVANKIPQKPKWDPSKYEEEDLEYRIEKKSSAAVRERVIVLEDEDEVEKTKIEKAKLAQQLQKPTARDDVWEEYNPEWWEGRLESGGYDAEVVKKASQNKKKAANTATAGVQKEKLGYEAGEPGLGDDDNDDDDDDDGVNRDQWAWGREIRRDQKIKYENSNVAVRLKQQAKDEELFPSLGANAETNANNNIIEQLYVKKPKASTQIQKKQLPNKRENKAPAKKEQDFKTMADYLVEEDAEGEQVLGQSQLNPKLRKTTPLVKPPEQLAEEVQDYPSLGIQSAVPAESQASFDPWQDSKQRQQQQQKQQKQSTKTNKGGHVGETEKSTTHTWQEGKKNNPFANAEKDNLKAEFPGLSGSGNQAEEEEEEQKQREAEQFSKRYQDQLEREEDILLNRNANNGNKKKTDLQAVNEWSNPGSGKSGNDVQRSQNYKQLGKSKKKGKTVTYIDGGFK